MILLDNTVLSNFALIRHPEFIHQAFVEEIGTTEQVFRELERGIQIGRLPKNDWTWLQQLQLTDAKKFNFVA
ncbi:hypothetical protein H8E88_21195 [candidate division KSB1 bacterium]|nr:hypothetical protein [candidate division KSB1 bacterium]MBL7095597.1 hypothetical protein [candidate division KSB1 bacterium]